MSIEGVIEMVYKIEQMEHFEQYAKHLIEEHKIPGVGTIGKRLVGNL